MYRYILKQAELSKLFFYFFVQVRALFSSFVLCNVTHLLKGRWKRETMGAGKEANVR
jgi:hypothetical protein